MTTINGSGNGSASGATAVCTINTDRKAWLDSEAAMDANYNVEDEKRFETLSRVEVKNSVNPTAQFSRMKLSDRERSILAEVAKINGWCRQGTEGMYKMAVAMDKDLYSIGDFLKALTQTEPGYFDKNGAIALGLTETDRRRLLGIPEDYVEPGTEGVDDDLASIDPSANANQKGRSNSVASAVDAMSRKLSDEEQAALSEAARINGLNEQSAVAYYKMYLAQQEEPSLEDFLQLLTQKAPSSYDKNGDLSRNDDKDRVILVTV